MVGRLRICLPMKGIWVQSLVRELRSNKSPGTAKLKKENPVWGEQSVDSLQLNVSNTDWSYFFILWVKKLRLRDSSELVNQFSMGKKCPHL